MAKNIATIKYRTEQASKLSAVDVDSNFYTQEAQTLASSNSLMYFGPSPSNTGWTISNSYYPSTPRSGRFAASILPNAQNVLGGNYNMVNGSTISFVFSATSSGFSQSVTYDWWLNLRNGYNNMVFMLSGVNQLSTVWEYKIATMSYDSSASTWKLSGSKISGPTNSFIDHKYTYMVNYKTTEPPNASYLYTWTASIPMSGQNFPKTIGTFSPSIISNSDYILSISSATVQFIGATGANSQVNPAFGINLLAGNDVMASATFSGTYSTNHRYKLRPTGLLVDGDSYISLTGTTFSSWGGITFSSGNSSRIHIVLTYQKLANADTGLEPIN